MVSVTVTVRFRVMVMVRVRIRVTVRVRIRVTVRVMVRVRIRVTVRVRIRVTVRVMVRVTVMSADKPREFWILYSSYPNEDTIVMSPEDYKQYGPYHNMLHVIEYRALTELQDKFSKYWDKTDLEISDLTKALQAEREVAAKLVDDMQAMLDWVGDWKLNAAQRAMIEESLAEYRNGRGEG